MAETFYTEEQKARLQTYRQAVREHVAPRAHEIDSIDRIPKDLLERLVKPPFSLPALSIPSRFGGVQMSKVEGCSVA